MQNRRVCFAALPASTLVWIFKQTGLYQSRWNNLKKGVRLFRYSYWFLRKSILKLADTKTFYACHSLGRYKENISNSGKASHPFLHQRLTNKLAKFYPNPTNLHTLLIQLNRDNSRKNKSRLFRLQIFSQFLQLKIIDQSDSIFNKLSTDI